MVKKLTISGKEKIEKITLSVGVGIVAFVILLMSIFLNLGGINVIFTFVNGFLLFLILCMVILEPIALLIGYDLFEE
jgi:hypothetical protein